MFVEQRQRRDGPQVTDVVDPALVLQVDVEPAEVDLAEHVARERLVVTVPTPGLE